MKKLFITTALMCMVTFTYAQKAELDAAQKALDKKDYNTALSQAQKGESILKSDGDANSDLVAKAMYIIGMAKLNLAGDNIPQIKEALQYLTSLADYESGKDYTARNNDTKKMVSFDSQKALDDAVMSGKYSKPKVSNRTKTYTPKMVTAIGEAGNGYYQKSINAYNSQQFKEAASLFELTYEAQRIFAPKADTALLNNAATCMIQARDYSAAKEYYKKLLAMGYTGVETIYEAMDELTGQRKVYASQKEMDAQVKLKLATDPTVRVETNKQPELYLTLMQILYQEDHYDEALKYGEEALAKFPENKDIFLLVGQIYYQKGDLDKFLENLLAAAKVFPNDAEIQYNLGYVYSEKHDVANAMAHYTKAIEIDPKYANAYINYASALLDDEARINEEIDKLPFTLNAAQKKQYDALIEQKKEMYKKVAEVLEKGYKEVPDNVSIVRILKNVYAGLGDDANMKKYEAVEKSLME